MVFVTVQNLVGIDAVFLIICTFFDSRVWLENAYSRPKIGDIRGKIGEEWDDIDPNELVLTFGGLHTCVQFGEDRRRNATVRISTDGHTHAQTQNDFIICPMLYAIAMRQIKIINNYGKRQSIVAAGVLSSTPHWLLTTLCRVYALLEHKRQEVYDRLLQIIDEQAAHRQCHLIQPL